MCWFALCCINKKIKACLLIFVTEIQSFSLFSIKLAVLFKEPLSNILF